MSKHEFTGERVIPGHVDANLWNEHAARYAFAERLARGRRVVDAGCGTGYGSAMLARCAALVTGLDVSAGALAYAREHYAGSNIHWTQASCTDIPIATASVDLVVAFEVIEHLTNWPGLLDEARRILAPGGQLIVSTPNKSYYAESRKQSGPNPFHEHEFEYDEFHEALSHVFPHLALFLEDHTEGILFKAVGGRDSADVRLDGSDTVPHDSNFFIAVCAMTPQTGAPTFVYLPGTGNILRERGLHIQRLETELRTKDEWLAEARNEHAALVDIHRAQTTELTERNRWAGQLNEKLKAAGERIGDLQQEMAREQEAAQNVIAGYEAKILELEEESRRTAEWAVQTDIALKAKSDELARCVELLHEAERTVEERTNWALRLDAQREALEGKVSTVEASRWVRLGRAFGLGPELRKS